MVPREKRKQRSEDYAVSKEGKAADNLGFTYHAVNEYIRKGEVDPAIKEQIDRKHKVSRFKFQTLPVYQNGLPIVLPEETDYYNPNKK